MIIFYLLRGDKMKTIYRILSLTVVFISMLLINSCTVQNQGPVGPPGRRGNDGIANIKILTYNIYLTDWARDNSQTNLWYFKITSPYINYDVIDYGTVLFYYGRPENDGNVNLWYALPFTDIYYEGDLTNAKIFDAFYYYQTIELTYTDTSPTFLDRPDIGDIRVKVVILEGTPINKIKLDSVNTKDYNQVKKIFNISD